jgi:hypothetical protein
MCFPARAILAIFPPISSDIQADNSSNKSSAAEQKQRCAQKMHESHDRTGSDLEYKPARPSGMHVDDSQWLIKRPSTLSLSPSPPSSPSRLSNLSPASSQGTLHSNETGSTGDWLATPPAMPLPEQWDSALGRKIWPEIARRNVITPDTADRLARPGVRKCLRNWLERVAGGNTRSRQALHDAISTHDLEQARRLLESRPYLAVMPLPKGHIPLLLAASMNDKYMTGLLAAAGARAHGLHEQEIVEPVLASLEEDFNGA